MINSRTPRSDPTLWRLTSSEDISTMASSSERFGNFEKADIQKLLEDKDSQNTKRSTKVCTGIFEDYLKEKNSEELAAILKKFYVEVRKTDGALYTKSSLFWIRFGLKSYFKSTLISSRTKSLMKLIVYTKLNVRLWRKTDLRKNRQLLTKILSCIKAVCLARIARLSIFRSDVLFLSTRKTKPSRA